MKLKRSQKRDLRNILIALVLFILLLLARHLLPAAIWLLRYASPRSASMLITSPVDFISGLSVTSTPGNLPKGNTASFTAV